MEFTHFDNEGNAIMVDVSHKEKTDRQAVAVGRITMSKECFLAIKEGRIKKGDVLAVARLSGIMATKKTSELIPLCHNIPIMKASVDFRLFEDINTIEAAATVKTKGETGVEMEALTGVTLALLTIYDMCKAVDKTMEIGSIYLEEKTGGKSGRFSNKR